MKVKEITEDFLLEPADKDRLASLAGPEDANYRQIEKRLGRKIDTMNTEDFVEYVGIFNSLKEGASKIAEWFESAPEANELTANIEVAMKAEQK